MYKYIFILFGLFIIFSCQEKDQKSNPENDLNATIVKSKISVSEIEANNEYVKFGHPQIMQINDEINCTGSIKLPPSSIYSIHPKVNGSIISIHVRAGDNVKRGSLLFRLSDPQIIEKQRVFLETNEKYILAKKEYERKKNLVGKNAISGTEYDLAQGNMKELLVSYTGLKSELKMLGIDIIKLEKENEFQQSIAVYSQTGGIVDQIYVNVGQRVSPDILLAKIMRTDDVYLQLNVLAKEIPLLKIGQKVEFSLPKMQETLAARVKKLSPVLDESKGSMTVYCEIEKSDCSHIISGMFVNAKILAGSREVKALSPTAYLKEGTEYFGFIANDNVLEKIDLSNFEFYNDHIILPDSFDKKILVKGAYYIE